MTIAIATSYSNEAELLHALADLGRPVRRMGAAAGFHGEEATRAAAAPTRYVARSKGQMWSLGSFIGLRAGACKQFCA